MDVRKVKAKKRREAARRAAAYAAKYLAKTFELERAKTITQERHRYEVGQGFQPPVMKRTGYRSAEDAVAFVLDHSKVVAFAVHSDTFDDYDEPPFLWVTLEPE